MVDHWAPGEPVNAPLYGKEAMKVINSLPPDIVPIIEGGSSFYIN
jgi:tRNA A37 N6-isopentenylltransferase MiaA